MGSNKSPKTNMLPSFDPRLSTMNIARLLAASGLVLAALAAAIPTPARAGALSNTYLRLDRLGSGSPTSLRVVFQTSATLATVDSVTVSLPGFTVNATQSVSSENCATGAGGSGATALTGVLSASGTGSTITVTGATAVTPDTRYCFDLTRADAVTNPAPGTYYPVIETKSSGSTVDSAKIALTVVGDDQLSVSAVVAPMFNFAFDGNAAAFTTDLSPGSVAATAGRTVTVNTNAKAGWIAWAKDSDANLGLRSASVAHTIPSRAAGTNATLAAGSEGYLWGVSSIAQGSGAGTTSADPAYNATGGSHGAGLDATLRPIATSNGTASSAAITLTARATVANTTPAAADYSDTITVVGAGSF